VNQNAKASSSHTRNANPGKLALHITKRRGDRKSKKTCSTSRQSYYEEGLKKKKEEKETTSNNEESNLTTKLRVTSSNPRLGLNAPQGRPNHGTSGRR
jgi:hypothetical protein